MHCKHQSSHSASHNNSGLLDPSYHLVDPKATSTHSPGHSISSRSSTWTDETGEHDPDFRPFEPLGSPQIYPSSPSPRRRSLELPGASAPNKSSRTLSRDQLEPELYAAIRNHRLTLAKEDEARAQQHRCESRRPSFLGIRRCRSKNSFREQPEAVFVDDNDDDSLAAYSPPPLPSLEIDSSSDTADEDQEEDEKNQPHHHHDLKHHLAGLTLRVDLAVFRAKKRLRQRVGLAD